MTLHKPGHEYFMVRRKSDGKYAKGGNYPRFGKKGKMYSMAGFAVEQFNICGRGAYLGHTGGTPGNPWAHKYAENEYKDYELVKFGDGGEVILWTGSRCTLTSKDIKKIKPNSRQVVGIRDEIGGLLDQIEEAEKKLKAGKPCTVDTLLAEIEVKESKLNAALEELTERKQNLRDMIKKIMDF